MRPSPCRGIWGPSPRLPQASPTKRKRKKKRNITTTCSSPSLPLPSAPHCQLWGWLSSALRLSGRARAHSPGLIYFFKGRSFILVGLGGKEGWGFVKCPLRRSFISLDFLLPPSSSRLPSSQPSCPGSGLLCLLSLPSSTPSPLSFLFFSLLFLSFFFKFCFLCFPSFGFPESLGEEGWAWVAGAGQWGSFPWCRKSPREEKLLPGSAQGLGLDLAKACCVCRCRATCIAGKSVFGTRVEVGRSEVLGASRWRASSCEYPVVSLCPQPLDRSPRAPSSAFRLQPVEALEMNFAISSEMTQIMMHDYHRRNSCL